MKRLLAAALLCASVSVTAADEPKPDPWEPVRFLVGDWTGEADGQAGKGTVVRHYEFVLGGKFLEERNTSTYPPQEKNPKGEVHEHRGFVSYDRKRKALMMRQFHQESFVTLYVLNTATSTKESFVFDSEAFENFDNSWKARETYQVVSKDEFVEVFELAGPGRPFEVYSRTHFKRRR